ncbi:hypothetical protein QFZ80_003474 [Paenibacillus sp. V4I7]|nr:hypothetical protein [Paenibacillus sp. V4I7]MDQ0914399.1 hypothetical protein [Paenibacillus sp. V4I5]
MADAIAAVKDLTVRYGKSLEADNCSQNGGVITFFPLGNIAAAQAAVK